MAAQNRREPVALAVIIRDQGSVPRHAGTKMLVYGDGRTPGYHAAARWKASWPRRPRRCATDRRALVPTRLSTRSAATGVCGGA
ncbi:MAG: XdhC family protein [Candidatus Promineofilum sp.]|nr:XdhC family protein [Promineifilum sp.]